MRKTLAALAIAVASLTGCTSATETVTCHDSNGVGTIFENGVNVGTFDFDAPEGFRPFCITA